MLPATNDWNKEGIYHSFFMKQIQSIVFHSSSKMKT